MRTMVAALVGTLPVAGRTLIERQARLATLAGAERIVLLIERLPGGLTGAIDRLRRDGIAIDVARSAGDAADRFHPDERVLIFADGATAALGAITRLATGPATGVADRRRGGAGWPVRTDRRERALGGAGARAGRHAAQDGGDARRLGSAFDAASPRGRRVGEADRHRRRRGARRAAGGDAGALSAPARASLRRRRSRSIARARAGRRGGSTDRWRGCSAGRSSYGRSNRAGCAGPGSARRWSRCRCLPRVGWRLR